jgi:photosystem II stability/assembly factor-like uncharacterized protein
MSKKLPALIFAIVSSSLFCQTRPGNFGPFGPGGGGAMFHPTVSPHDLNTVLVACDMTGSYITHDSGKSWRMFNLRDPVQFFAFDPSSANIIYAGTRALWRSTDSGETWKLLYPSPSAVKGIQMNSDHSDEIIIAEPDPLGIVNAFTVDPGDSHVLYAAATKKKRSALFESRDFGNSWRELHALPEPANHLWINPGPRKGSPTLIVLGKHFAAVREKVTLRIFPTSEEFTDAAAGFSEKNTLVYGTSANGLYLSKDLGATWEKTELPGKGTRAVAVATSLRHREIAYVSYEHMMDESSSNGAAESAEWFGVAKTIDGGSTWRIVWKEKVGDPAANIHDAWITNRLGPEWAGNPLSLGVAEQDPNVAYATDYGRTMQTTDGGATWNAMYSKKIDSQSWTSTGLDVTTSYGIHFDPFDHRRQFITYTDIGLFRSEDGGKSWQSSTNGVPEEWRNTTYWVVFDPDVRGRMWSVNSGTHDLPRPKMWRKNSVLNYRGGVCRSDDGGKTWTKSNSGMEETAPTHILLDPRSPANARVLYVAAMGRGVYKSTDDGRSWTLKNNGIIQSQPLAWRLALDSNGTLYVVIARRSEDGSIGNEGDGALYRSSDSAESWQQVTLPRGVNGLNGIAVDTRDHGRIYLAAWARASGVHGDGGGIFVSDDGGKTWSQVLDRDRHVYDVTIDPRNADVLYASGFESSAWRSIDRGEHWTRIPGFNFKWGHRVIPDPTDPDSIYVTTFGGSIWHGRVDGESRIVDIATPEMDPGEPK